MLNIGSFFDKFKNAVSKEMALRQSILNAITKSIAINGANTGLTIKDIELRNKILRINASSVVKNQIFIKKESILRNIRETNPTITIIDLR